MVKELCRLVGLSFLDVSYCLQFFVVDLFEVGFEEVLVFLGS